MDRTTPVSIRMDRMSGFVDGSIRFVPDKVPADLVRQLIDREDGGPAGADMP